MWRHISTTRVLNKLHNKLFITCNKLRISHVMYAGMRWRSGMRNCATSYNLTLSLLMLHICGVSKTFGEWYQKTNKTEDTNKLTLLAYKIIAIIHNTRLATFIKLLKTVRKGLFRNRSQNSCQTFLDCRRKAAIQERVTEALWTLPTVCCEGWRLFGNAEIRLILFAAQCFNTESMQQDYLSYRWDLIRYAKG
jgi:hypothetical protein